MLLQIYHADPGVGVRVAQRGSQPETLRQSKYRLLSSRSLGTRSLGSRPLATRSLGSRSPGTDRAAGKSPVELIGLDRRIGHEIRKHTL